MAEAGFLFVQRQNLNLALGIDYYKGNRLYRSSAPRSALALAILLPGACSKSKGDSGNRDQGGIARFYGLSYNRFGLDDAMQLVEYALDKGFDG